MKVKVHHIEIEIDKEPMDMDFVVDPRPLSKEDQLKISAFIKADKKRRKGLLGKKRQVRTTSR
jgi:hypothetical protein